MQFRLILDDPLSNSNIEGEDVEETIYPRTFEQYEDLEIPFVPEYQNVQIDDVIEGAQLIAQKIRNAQRIVGFTGAGVSVGLHFTRIQIYRVWSSCLSNDQ